MDEAKIKVTDRRLFTEDGELREEYNPSDDEANERDLEATSGPAPPSNRASGDPAAASGDPATASSDPAATSRGATGPDDTTDPASAEPPLEEGAARGATSRASEEGLREPQFVDLVASLAEPIALFLGDAQLPGGESAQDLGRARYYIDLMNVLREKTQGNLSAEEEALLSDLVYRLQMRYVQKKG